MKRRELITGSLAAGSLAAWSARATAQEPGGQNDAPSIGDGPVENAGAVVPAEIPEGLVDTNVSLGAWPFRRLPLEGRERLAERLGALGVNEAWVSNFEGLLHRDLRGVNERLAEACAAGSGAAGREGETGTPARPALPVFVPVGVLNPLDPAWEGDLARCFEVHGMRIFRLHPAWHGYGLDAPEFAELLDAASASGVLLQVSVLLEDVRTQHPVARVAEVDLSPLPELLEAKPGARVQILNARLRGVLLEQLAAAKSLCFDTARTESTSGVRDLAAAVGAERVLYGSHAPFLIPEAALVRVGEADFEPGEEATVLGGNARRLLAGERLAGFGFDVAPDPEIEPESAA